MGQLKPYQFGEVEMNMSADQCRAFKEVIKSLLIYIFKNCGIQCLIGFLST